MQSTGLTRIDPWYFPKMGLLKKLQLHHQYITYIAPASFKALTSVEALMLLDNRIATLVPYALQGLISVNSLILDSNRITKLTRMSFYGVKKGMARLNLDNNLIGSVGVGLEPGCFSELYNVDELQLANNRLTRVDASVFGTFGINTHVDFSYNQISNFSDGITKGIQYLDDINLANNEITQLEPAWFKYGTSPMIMLCGRVAFRSFAAL